MEGSTALATRSTGAELMDQLDIRFSDTEELQVKIAMRLAMAATPEELFGEGGTLGWEKQEGKPVVIRRISWLPSTKEKGLGFYALVEGADAETGEELILTTGATNVVIQLARAEQQGWLGQPVILRRNPEPTSNGFYPHRLYLA